jgi:hypothetical protein
MSWLHVITEGTESVTEEERSGRPATSRTEENFARFRQILRANRWLNAVSISEKANIDRETKDLN